MKRTIDDLGSTIDSEDNLVKMIMIEQAIDAAHEIEEPISRSYAFSDCIVAILDFARESSNEILLERIEPLFEQITNKGAQARTLSYFAVALASFNHEEEAEEKISDAIRIASQVKDDFDRRDVFLDISTSVSDVFFLTDNRKMIDMVFKYSEQLTEGQQAYLFGYISMLLPEDEGAIFMRKASEIAEKISDPITRSKVFLELANFLSNSPKTDMES